MVQFLSDAAEEAVWENVRSCIATGGTLDVSRTAKGIVAQRTDERLSQARMEDLLARAAISAGVAIPLGPG